MGCGWVEGEEEEWGVEDVEGCHDEGTKDRDSDADGADAAVVDDVSRTGGGILVFEDENICRGEVGVA